VEANPRARRVLVALMGALLAVPSGIWAQQPQKRHRIGFLISERPSDQASRIEALRFGLRERGYVEGKNVAIEIRSADGNYERLPELAAELVRLEVDVLVTFGSKATLAARHATATIPIVVPVIGDPVAVGVASSLGRPEQNVTGSATFGLELGPKRIELLKEAVPAISQVAWLRNPANAITKVTVRSMESTASSLKLGLKLVDVPAAKNLTRTFATITKERIDAIAVSSDTFFQTNARTIGELAVKHRLPSIGALEFAEAGGLIGYGFDDAQLYRRSAYFVHRLLSGAKPADLPIERPTMLNLVINMRTAKALGITIPQAIRLRADRVIE
jgi:putative tryptophan/tyrosine transport system substrate-binding protein